MRRTKGDERGEGSDEQFLKRLTPPDALVPTIRAALAAPTLLNKDADFNALPLVRDIRELPEAARAEAAVDAAQLLSDVSELLEDRDDDRARPLRVYTATRWLIKALLRSPPPKLGDGQLCTLIGLMVQLKSHWFGLPVAPVVTAAERIVQQHGASPRLTERLGDLRAIQFFEQDTAESRKLLGRIRAMLDERQPLLPLKEHEPWARDLIEFVGKLPSHEKAKWSQLVEAAKSAPGSAPSAKWLKQTARPLVEAVGAETFKEQLRQWMRLASKGVIGPNPFTGEGTCELGLDTDNADVLRGLIWAAASLDDPSLALPIADFAEACYRKLPNVGPRCAKAGNACVAALAAMTGDEPAAQLSRLVQKVKQPSGRKMAEKALAKFAGRAGLTPQEVEERNVPTYGLGADGSRRDTFGEFTATTKLVGGDVEVTWQRRGSDKPQKSVPASVKEDQSAKLKALQTVHKQIKTAVPAQRHRIERLFIQDRSWPTDVWRECYIDHPLVGSIARRLIWVVGETPALVERDAPRDVNGKSVKAAAETPVRIWHPAGRPADEVAAWRNRLETLQITQPFKQAHREVYVLTDAERTTRTYSNRFASHILRQHQFQALATQRGWKYSIMGMWDSHNIPTIELPQQQVRVEFWVEGIGDRALSQTGACLYVSTDQVRFYPAGSGRPMPLERVPPLLFSELMRDVDLFVGVASVGNDPQWQDQGIQDYQAYWQRAAFGELSETGRTRRDVLQRLVGRLKIAGRCSIAERFLVVRGDLRTYKIHLGSGNIYMEPNDQYLCIVPDAAARGRDRSELFLPFDGDETLSVIISKALLLADDTKITDPTITRQIEQR